MRVLSYIFVAVLCSVPLGVVEAQVGAEGQIGAEARLELGAEATGTSAGSGRGEPATEAQGSSELGAEADAGLELGGAEAGASGEASFETQTQTRSDKPQDTDSERARGANESVTEGVLRGEAVVVVGSEVRAKAQEGSAELGAYDAARNEITLAPQDVSTRQQLTAYAEATAAVDGSVEATTISDERVEMRYRMPAKLFGFVEASLPVRAEVALGGESEGRVKVNYPWYAFLFSKGATRGEVVSTIESEVAPASFAVESRADAGATLRQRAEILSRLHTALRASATARAEAKAEG